LKVAWLEVHGTTEFVFSNNIYIYMYIIYMEYVIYIYGTYIYIYTKQWVSMYLKLRKEVA